MSERPRGIEQQLPDEEMFDLTAAADHELVKKYQPKFLARGGQQVIYEIPGHLDVVAKVEVEPLIRIQQHNQKQGLPPEAMDPEILPDINAALEKKRAGYQDLRKYFGSEHVLPSRNYLIKVPMTPKMMDWLYVIYANTGPYPSEAVRQAREVWAILEIQRRAPELENPDRLGFASHYIENEVSDSERYRRITAALLELDPSAHYVQQEFDALMIPSTQDLLKAADADPKLAETLRDLTRRTIQYANETKTILDLASGDNLPVFKKPDGSWTYRLVDALYPDSSEMLSLARDAALKATRGEVEMGDPEWFYLHNAVNFVRFINGLARRFGVEGQIDFIPEEAKGKIDYLKLFTGE